MELRLAAAIKLTKVSFLIHPHGLVILILSGTAQLRMGLALFIRSRIEIVISVRFRI